MKKNDVLRVSALTVCIALGFELFLFSASRSEPIKLVATVVILATTLTLGWYMATRRQWLTVIYAVAASLFLSSYLTATAFLRYRGLAKDLEPATGKVLVYGLRFFVSFLVAFAVVAAARVILLAFHRRLFGKADYVSRT